MTRGKVLITENSQTPLTIVIKDNALPEKKNQFIASFAATLSAFALGMCLTWTSPAIPMLQKSRPNEITVQQEAWIGSLLTLGACCGAIPTGMLANLFGRKRTLQFASIPMFISWLMIAWSQSVVNLYIARFIAGLASGAICVVAPMYVAEIAHISVKGTLGTFFQFQITVGLLVEYILGGTIVNFQFLALASSLLPVVFLILFSFMPESPVYLYSKNRIDDACYSLKYFRGIEYDCNDELMQIAQDIDEAQANKVTFADLIDCKATMKGLIISLGLMVFQQLSGINAVLFYAGNIFAETGSSMSPDTSAILVGAVQVAATFLSTILVDKAGRKLLLFISSFVMCICLISLGSYFCLKETHDLTSLSTLPLICLAVYIVVFSIGFGPIPWMMIGELFTPKTKGIASSISAASNWLLAFTVTNQFQNMVMHLGIGITFVIFGCICGVGVLFVILIVPETKGKDANQVQQMLLGEKLNGKCLDKKCDKTTCV